MTKKYELTTESIDFCGRALYRIRALKDFSDVKVGELGGYVEKEDNLSQEDDCWVYDEAKIYDNAKVCGYAEVYDNAKVSDSAEVFDNAQVHGDADVFDNAEVFGNAEIFDNAEVFGDAKVFGNAKIYHNTKVSGNISLFNQADISKNSNYISVNSIGSEDGTLTAFKLQNGSIFVNRGCFRGTLDEFIEAVKKTHGDNTYAQDYFHLIEIIKNRLLQ